MDRPQQSHTALNRRPLLALLWGAIVFSMVALGLTFWPRPRPADPVELPAQTTMRLLALRDGPQGEFVLDQPAPDFALEDADGQELRLSDLRGQPVVLNFWATWCVPCKAEMPELQALYNETGAGAGFELLAVNMREVPAPAAAFGTELGLSFPLVIDPAGLLAGSFRVTVLPTTYVIDAAGVVRAQQLGPLDRERLRELLALQP
jgi:cytochrome c biogenesis protein CcmG/thiol:disulfide interchange protein DsbE